MKVHEFFCLDEARADQMKIEIGVRLQGLIDAYPSSLFSTPIDIVALVTSGFEGLEFSYACYIAGRLHDTITN